jgi:hypothetical protein
MSRDWFEVDLSEVENLRAELKLEKEKRTALEARLLACELSKSHALRQCLLLQVRHIELC